jgi:hypothetical protein
MTKRRTISILLLVAALVGVVSLELLGASQPDVRVASMDAVGPRPLEQQTRTAIVRDYLEAWQNMGKALELNRADLLNGSFVGLAKDKLSDTIRAQKVSKIRTSYRERSHDLKVVFYSPEGLSIQLMDDAEYDVEVRHSGQSLGTQHVKTHYVAVLTPTESKWKVRILQGGS